MSSTVLLLATVACLLIGVAQPLPVKPSWDGPSDLVVLPNTPQNIAALATGKHQQNAEELSGQFEGDMVLNTEQQLLVQGLLTVDEQRNGLLEERYRWPNNTVPVLLTEGHFDQAQTAHIYKALRTLESVSCVRFVNYTSGENYVRLLSSLSGCFSNIGYNENARPQYVNLQQFPVGQGCFTMGTIVHEFLHTLGFYHMQSSTERDDYVRIAWENVSPGDESQFYKRDANRITNFQQPYDLTSVMHYSAYALSKNGNATIIPHDISMLNVMGKRGEMSDNDIARLNAMYKCAA